jgi:hypothetical protein
MSIFNFNRLFPQSQWPNAKRKAGSLLIELVIGIALLATVSGSMLAWYTSIVKEQSSVLLRAQALMYATTLLEKLRATGQKSTETHHRFKVTWHTHKDSVVSSYTFIEIHVQWQEGRKMQMIILKTGQAGK